LRSNWRTFMPDEFAEALRVCGDGLLRKLSDAPSPLTPFRAKFSGVGHAWWCRAGADDQGEPPDTPPVGR
jgi:hypothetical protein